MAKYVIVHSMVGPHMGGELVNITPEHEKGGTVQIQRLIDIGAIRKATSDDEGEPVEWGNGTADVPRPFPAVPFQATEPTTDATAATTVVDADTGKTSKR